MDRDRRDDRDGDRDRERLREDRDRDRDRGRDGDRSRSRDGPRERTRDRSPSPALRERDRVRSPSPRRERSRSPPPRGSDADGNPGTNLYISGLSSRTTERDVEEHFGKEGKVSDCRLVADPRTKESRGFAFVMMETRDDANRCIKYLDRSVLQGRVITVALAKRARPRTPTPGKFLGVRPIREMVPHEGPYGGPDRRGGYDRGGYDRGDPGRDPYRAVRRSSPDYGPYRRDRSPDYGPYSRGRY